MKRTKGEVMEKILEVCQIGASKTRIVYGSNLNFITVLPYLDSLTKNGSIAAMDGKYKTTDKGKELLTAIKKVNKVF